ncbi:hypothetical protein Pmar_PMAR020614 [Perkinsus marinus ATCC 50983]|uniref:Uncharacterized protein n=1 Tax=Perkinsus marinus (strain ATCC 50983 / TXsc) TaxID=423536 RepID=C5L7J0_PERM5|nr:hypothetical protein Pmar_PMAR020614 [Perkinsus marinus ATCC 50983]EER07452.1 hypothetical protein Pmar_PMAR020614 [Perkinsus marinus ATCC 50983]|eukprot:XP_002775636.1 hypothetical protein Pmar_PMAR020614 [Perkinsus marinus ATCC 50983]
MTVWDLVEVLDIMATHSQCNAQVKRYHIFLTKFAERLLDLHSRARSYTANGNALGSSSTALSRPRETFTPDICVAACHALVIIGIHVRDTLNMTSFGSDPEGKYTIALLALQPELPPAVLTTITSEDLKELARWCLYDLVRDDDVRMKANTIFSLGVLSRLQLIPQEYPHQQWPDKTVELSIAVRRSVSELDVSRSLEISAQPRHDNYQLDRQVKVVDLVRLSMGLELLRIPSDTSLVVAVEKEVNKAVKASSSAVSGAVPALWWTTQIARRTRYHTLPLWHRQCLNDIDHLKKTDRWKASLALIATLNALESHGQQQQRQPLWDEVDAGCEGYFSEADMNFLNYVLSHNCYQMRHREQVSWEVDMMGVNKRYFKNPQSVTKQHGSNDDNP